MYKFAYVRGYLKLASLIGGPQGPNIGNLRQMYQNGQINGNQFGNFADRFGTGMRSPSKVSGGLISDSRGLSRFSKPRISDYAQGGLNRGNRGFGGLSGSSWGFQGGLNPFRGWGRISPEQRRWMTMM